MYVSEILCGKFSCHALIIIVSFNWLSCICFPDLLCLFIQTNYWDAVSLFIRKPNSCSSLALVLWMCSDQCTCGVRVMMLAVLKYIEALMLSTMHHCLNINSNVTCDSSATLLVVPCCHSRRGSSAKGSRERRCSSEWRLSGANSACFIPRLLAPLLRVSVSPLSLYPSIHLTSSVSRLCYRAYLELPARLVKQVSLAGRCSKKKRQKERKRSQLSWKKIECSLPTDLHVVSVLWARQLQFYQ